MAGMLHKWAERHRRPLNLALHAAGIPLTIAALPLLLAGRIAFAAALFLSGYALQFVGHAVEGNKAGEQILVERLLRRRPPPAGQ
ncbi:MAG: DUF962 domain-containing protein [bacterium]|nr:DUF962 domain-containing protein [bacterium]